MHIISKHTLKQVKITKDRKAQFETKELKIEHMLNNGM